MMNANGADILTAMEPTAEEAAQLLAAMANAKRLLVLCNLLEGEKCVGDLADRVGLAVPALSQHLAKLRALGLVATRRDGHSIHYRLAGTQVAEILMTLHGMFCAAGPAQPVSARSLREPHATED